jgi:RNA polymerase sigma factor (sigma-70 family)
MMMRYAQPDWSDEELVDACRDGDQSAWDTLVERYKKLVYSVPVRYQLPPEDSADVFQGVWMDLYRNLHRLERVAGLRAWLLTAAARRSMLHKKRRQRSVQANDLDPQVPDTAPFADLVIENAQRAQHLRHAVEQLPPRCQQLVRMLFFEHPSRPYSEIARELGLAEGSIGFIRGRCLAKLRKYFEQAQ